MILRRGLVRARPAALGGRPSARALGNMVQDFAKRTLLENAASFSNGDASVFSRPAAHLQAQAISTDMSVDSATWKSIVVRAPCLLHCCCRKSSAPSHASSSRTRRTHRAHCPGRAHCG